MNKDIKQLLKDRVFLDNEHSREDLCDRVGEWFPKIKHLLQNMIFIPSSPFLMNANTKGVRVGTLSSCFPLVLHDSIEGIYDALKECAIVTQYSGGVGFNLSALRGKNEPIKGIMNKPSSGAVSFISPFNATLDAVSQCGSRKGAGMFMLDITHPDILDFIEFKKDYKQNKANRFNFTVRIPNSFYADLKENSQKPMKIQTVVSKEWRELKDNKGKVVTVKDLTPMEHLLSLSSISKNISLPVSKTINLPESATKEDISEVYIKAHELGVIGVSVYRDGSREGILHTKVAEAMREDLDLPVTIAPKRPKKVIGDIHFMTIKGEKIYVVLGKYEKNEEKKPYEIFTGINSEGDNYIPHDVKKNDITIEKKKRGHYVLFDSDKNKGYVLTGKHSDSTAEALTRQISLNLRHGTDIGHVVHQLEKTKGDLNSFSKALQRVLKKYIKEGFVISGEDCPKCENKLVRESGCISCKQCGWSKC